MTLRVSPRWRHGVMLALLAVAAWLALFGDKTPPGAPTPAAVVPARPDTQANIGTALRRPPAAAAKGSAADAAVAIEALVPRKELLPKAGRGARRDLFAVPPSPPMPKPAAMALPTPMAPPMPFRFIGKKLDAGTWEVFVGREDASYLVRVGSVLEANYRVDSIEPPSMLLTHLPTRQTQTLAIGDAW